MSNYICCCGKTYTNKNGINFHTVNYPDHVYFRLKWHDRLLNFITDKYNPKWLKFIGLIGVHAVFINHFDYSFKEAIISALCLGFLL